jgi:hypothetical protein
LTGGASGLAEGAGGAAAGSASGEAVSAAPAAGAEVAGEGIVGNVAKEGGIDSLRAASEGAVNPSFESAAGQAATAGNGLGAQGSTTGAIVGGDAVTPLGESSSAGFGGIGPGVEGTSSPGMLGTAGDQAAAISNGQGAIGPGFGTMGAPDAPNPYTGAIKQAARIHSASNNVEQLIAPTDYSHLNDMNPIPEGMPIPTINENQATIDNRYYRPRQQIVNQLMMNRWGAR